MVAYGAVGMAPRDQHHLRQNALRQGDAGYGKGRGNGRVGMDHRPGFRPHLVDLQMEQQFRGGFSHPGQYLAGEVHRENVLLPDKSFVDAAGRGEQVCPAPHTQIAVRGGQ